MTGFSVDWLDLRENADHRARNMGLMRQALQWLESGLPMTHASVLVDLGAGTGATLRALSASAATPLTWRLVDHDHTLLAEARRRHGAHYRLETCVTDLARIQTLPLEDARLVTASALFDLVSEAFIEALTTVLQNRCLRSPVGLYAALNYDGTTQWTPSHPLDDVILSAFNHDQGKDKGFGPALGPAAVNFMQQVLTEAGFVVSCASSPWMLDRADHALINGLIDGITAAVEKNPQLDTALLKEWTQFRKNNVRTGTCMVGHTDLLALPDTEMRAD